ncbi:hypothetical protein [Amycolatopsis samaneae]|uniref:DUF2029 domain-containing protein n=1 Tax=Amycolatopsis samaneae TaxID=664691 RepID=A0ABW5G8Y2_9PSEU
MKPALARHAKLGSLVGKTVTAQRLWAYLGLLTVTLLNVISHANLEPGAHRKAWGDAVNYYRMSEQTGAPVDNPFALRMLSPWLVHRAHLLTGVSLDTLWLGLTVIFTFAALVVFFEFLWSRLNVRLFTAVLISIALACTFWYAPYAFSNPYLVDPLNNLAYVCALYAAFDRRLVLFTAIIVLGSLNKETTLLLAPLYPLLAWSRSRTLRDRGVLAGAAVMVVAGGVYFGYRLWAQHLIGGDYGFGAGQANGSLLGNIQFALSANKGTDQLELFTTFHFFWLVFAYGLYQLYRRHGLRSELLVASIWVFACCVAGRLVATDTTRVFVMMAPLVLGVTALVLDKHRDERRQHWVGLLVFLYLAVSLRWVPAPASFFLDVAGAGVFVALITFPVRLPGTPPPVATP